MDRVPLPPQLVEQAQAYADGHAEPAEPRNAATVVLLRDVYELPHEDIAAELGISETAAKVRLHRARRQLKEHLFPRREGQPVGDEIRAS